MRLRNEFVVAAPLEQTWRALLDVPRVASALPGATIEAGGDAGAYRGRLTVKIGPVTAQYDGTARVEGVDEDAHTASFYVQGAGGQGSAAATITNRLALLELDPKTQKKIREGKTTASKALAESNGADDKPKMLGRKKIVEIMEEFGYDTVERRLLEVVLGMREKI